MLNRNVYAWPFYKKCITCIWVLNTWHTCITSLMLHYCNCIARIVLCIANDSHIFGWLLSPLYQQQCFIILLIGNTAMCYAIDLASNVICYFSFDCITSNVFTFVHCITSIWTIFLIFCLTSIWILFNPLQLKPLK